MENELTYKQAVDNIVKVIDNVKQTDDNIIKITKNLDIILLNLKIENARIKNNTGIEPIANNLKENIDEIRREVAELIKANRELANGALEKLKEIE